MKVVEFQSYQAVRLSKGMFTFFHAESAPLKGIEMEAQQHGILIKTELDEVIVPFANIMYYKPEKSKSKVVKKSND